MKRIFLNEFQPIFVLIQIVIISLTVEIDALGEKILLSYCSYSTRGVILCQIHVDGDIGAWLLLLWVEAWFNDPEKSC